MKPKYPNIHVKLTGSDGNGMVLIAKVSKAMKRARLAPEEVHAFVTEAMDGDYHHLLRTCLAYVDCR